MLHATLCKNNIEPQFANGSVLFSTFFIGQRQRRGKILARDALHLSPTQACIISTPIKTSSCIFQVPDLEIYLTVGRIEGQRPRRPSLQAIMACMVTALSSILELCPPCRHYCRARAMWDGRLASICSRLDPSVA